MSSFIMKAVSCLMTVLLLLGVSIAFGWSYYPASHNWGFDNYCYLSFNQAMNFTETPRQGLFNDSSLVGYWSMNEGVGLVAYDSSGNNNNGMIVGALWVDGKFGKALSFDGVDDYVDVLDPAFHAFAVGSISVWFKLNSLPAETMTKH